MERKRRRRGGGESQKANVKIVGGEIRKTSKDKQKEKRYEEEMGLKH